MRRRARLLAQLESTIGAFKESYTRIESWSKAELELSP